MKDGNQSWQLFPEKMGTRLPKLNIIVERKTLERKHYITINQLTERYPIESIALERSVMNY